MLFDVQQVQKGVRNELLDWRLCVTCNCTCPCGSWSGGGANRRHVEVDAVAQLQLRSPLSCHTCARRSEGFPRTRITQISCACDCGKGPVSVGTFFFLLSFFFLPSSLIEIFVGKSDVLGGSGGRVREGENEKNTKNGITVKLKKWNFFWTKFSGKK